MDVVITNAQSPLHSIPLDRFCQNATAPPAYYFTNILRLLVPGSRHSLLLLSVLLLIHLLLTLVSVLLQLLWMWSLPAQITPTFDPVGPFCQNATDPLPTTSLILPDYWYLGPAFSTATVGTTTYTFTPDAGQCATTTTMDVVITNLRSPLTFDPSWTTLPERYCSICAAYGFN